MNATSPPTVQVPPMEELLRWHLEWGDSLEGLLRELVTEEVMTLPVVSVELPRNPDSVEESPVSDVERPGYKRLAETYFLSLGTWTTVRFLMMNNPTSGKVDFTEDAAVLLRRMFDLLAQVLWLVQAPSGESKEWTDAAVGRFEDFDSVISDYQFPDQDMRNNALAPLCAATTWMDVQALRAELEEIRDLKNLQKAAKEMPATLSETDHISGGQVNQQNTAEAAEFALKLTRARLSAMKALTSEIENTFDILDKTNKTLAFGYRRECDAAHGGRIQRVLNREKDQDGGIIYGKPATPERRVQVVQASNEVMSALSGITLEIFHGHFKKVIEFRKTIPTASLI